MESKIMNKPSDQEIQIYIDSSEEYGRIVRQEFSSEEDAKNFFNIYAKRKGFNIRKSKVWRIKREGPVYFRTFVCFKAGHREEKYLNVNDSKRKPRALTRCGCPVWFSLKLHHKTGRWYVHDFYDVHNHELALP